jgi:phosphinothricin acetyltransferase
MTMTMPSLMSVYPQFSRKCVTTANHDGGVPSPRNSGKRCAWLHRGPSETSRASTRIPLVGFPENRHPSDRLKMTIPFRIESLTTDDWPAVRAIYLEGLATGVGSFETEAPSWEQWHAARLSHSRLVARAETVLAWAALSAVSPRLCYAGVAEVAIYVAASARGRGVGRALLEALISSAEAHGIWTLQGATIAGNSASLALQTRCGFRVVGRRERIAKRDGVWHDTILTERRSPAVGLD